MREACLPMLYKTLSAAVYGIDASIIEVEVDVSGIKSDEDHFHTVGLPDAAVRESRDRVKAALKNCGTTLSSSTWPRPTLRKKAPASTCPWRWASWAHMAGLIRRKSPIVCLWVSFPSMAVFAVFVEPSLSPSRPANGRFHAS